MVGSGNYAGIQLERAIKGKFTAIIEAAPEGGYWAVCPEISGANEQGDTPAEARESLRHAIQLILQGRTADAPRGLPDDVIRDKMVVERSAESRNADSNARAVIPSAKAPLTLSGRTPKPAR